MGTSAASATSRTETVEIRLLGNLRIRDAAGEPIDLGALRTRKTLDLLRLLALRVGEPVTTSLIVQRLWPDVPEPKGRASLRTAASTIRSVLGQDRLERRLGGLVLCEAWVDTVAFTTLAVESRISLREGRPAQAIVAAREAEALYLHDFRADDDAASWVVTERNQLRAMYGRLLEDTAEAALSLGWYRDVEDFASRAITLDPFAERPVRALMTAFAATGQVERALRVFQICRNALVEELGVDPSVPTDALHVSILRGGVSAPVPRAVRLVGRDRELSQLVGAIRRGVDDGRPCVVELRGASGSGRRRLVDEACRQVGVGWRPSTDDAEPSGRRGDVQVLVGTASSFLREVPGRPGGSVDGFHGIRVLVTSQHDPEIRSVAESRGWEHLEIVLPALDLEATARLTEAVFGGAASAPLLREIFDTTRGEPGSVVAAARQMMRAARVVSTSEGLALTHEGEGSGRSIDAAAMVSRALEVLPAESHQVLHVLAVADTALPLATVLGLLEAPDPVAVGRALDMLVDVSILSSTSEGYRFRHPQAAVAVRGWLRPSVRRALGAAVAASAAVPTGSRLSAWSRAGEPAMACRLAVQAASDARVAGLDVEADAFLEWARTLASSLGSAVDALLAEGAPASAEMQRPRRPPVVATDARLVDVDAVAHELGLAAGTARDAAEVVLREAMRCAAAAVEDRPGDTDAGDRFAALSVLLAERVLVPGRSLDALDEVVDDLPTHTSRPDLLGEGEILRWLPRVLLGHAAAVRGPIEAEASQEGRPALVGARLRRLAVLAEHDLGNDSAHELNARHGQTGHWTRSLPFRLLVERRCLVLPRQHQPGDAIAGTAMFRQLRALATADRHESAGQAAAALQVLRTAADDALESGCTLMLPEIASRLVILGCMTDAVHVQHDFDLMDAALGLGAAHPREVFLRYVARAHVRSARGDRYGAAVAADAAARVARESGLMPLAREADGLSNRFSQAGRGTAG